MATQGKYAVVDTTLSITDSTPIPGLNGRQGDNGRIVYFALKDGRLPHNLDGQDVALEVKDAAGKIKVVNGIYDMISATAGLFSMLIPAEVYQAAGDVEEAYLSVIDNAGTTISSIPITFTVFANGVIISANASKDYIDSIQKILDEFNERITTTSNNLETVRTAVNSLNDAITNYTDLVNTKAAAVKTSTNEFTENNTFDKDVTVLGTIHGNADSATKLQTPRKINGTNFDGTADINVNAANDSNLVHTTGTEAVAGAKTFMDGVSLNGKNEVNNLTDTDWLDIPLVEGRTGKAQYKVSLGKIFIHLDGVKGMSGVGLSDTASHIGNLPKGGYHHTRNATILYKSFITITCTPDGLIYISAVVGDQPTVDNPIYTDFVLI